MCNAPIEGGYIICWQPFAVATPYVFVVLCLCSRLVVGLPGYSCWLVAGVDSIVFESVRWCSLVLSTA